MMMADVKWIKITTDIFDDEKILLIESLPDAYAIITVWFKLLCLAGKQNNSGVFMMGQIAYTDKMLATIFRMKEATVTMALQTFEQFGMVEIIDGVITIPNWGKHQTLDAYEKKKKRDRLYQKERRAAQKALIACSPEKSSDSQKTPSSDVAVSEVEVDKDTDKEVDKECVTVEKSEKMSPYTHISSSVYQELCKKYGKAFVDSKAEKAYNDKALIKFCEQDFGKPSKTEYQNRFNTFPQREYDMAAIERMLLEKKNPPVTVEDDPDLKAKADALKKKLQDGGI